MPKSEMGLSPMREETWRVCLPVGVGAGVGEGCVDRQRLGLSRERGTRTQFLFSMNRCRGEKGKEK